MTSTLKKYLSNLCKNLSKTNFWKTDFWQTNFWKVNFGVRQKDTPLLPKNTIGGRAFAMVTATMCFLACLALGAALLVNAASSRWISQAKGAATVQIVETDTQSAKEQLPATLAILARTNGVASASPLSDERLVQLLEPWLGAGNVIADLPLPILIDVRLSENESDAFNPQALALELKAVAPGAHIDTHGTWRETLSKAALFLRLLAGFILLLIVGATGTVMIFATRAALTANKNVLEVLHLIGATDGFIARQFTSHLVYLSFLSCLLGFALAVFVFYFAQNLVPTDNMISFFMILALTVPLITIFSYLITHYYVTQILRKPL